MAPAVDRQIVRDFYAALQSRNAERIAAFVADEVDWLLIGPVEILRFCGPRRTRAEVFDLFEHAIPSMLEVTGFIQEYLLVDDDCAATLNRLTAVQRSSGRVITYRIAHFARFRQGEIVEFRSVADTFDAVEQMLGRHLQLPDA